MLTHLSPYGDTLHCHVEGCEYLIAPIYAEQHMSLVTPRHILEAHLGGLYYGHSANI
jgi:hypothetical protein